MNYEKLIIKEVSIVKYFNEFVKPLNKKFRGLSENSQSTICPFHNDTDPSFHYWAKKKRYHCFGCGASGDVLKLHQQIQFKYHKNKLTMLETAKELNRIYNLGIDFDTVKALEEETMYEQVLKRLNSDYLNQKSISSVVAFRKKNDALLKHQNSGIALDILIENYAKLDQEFLNY